MYWTNVGFTPVGTNATYEGIQGMKEVVEACFGWHPISLHIYSSKDLDGANGAPNRKEMRHVELQPLFRPVAWPFGGCVGGCLGWLDGDVVYAKATPSHFAFRQQVVA